MELGAAGAEKGSQWQEKFGVKERKWVEAAAETQNQGGRGRAGEQSGFPWCELQQRQPETSPVCLIRPGAWVRTATRSAFAAARRG